MVGSAETGEDCATTHEYRMTDTREFAGVSSRLVSRFKADVLPCPRCQLTPVEATVTSANGATRHRFQCLECRKSVGKWAWSHREAAAKWNEYATKQPA